MRNYSYQDPAYRLLQSVLTKRSWKLGQHALLIKPRVVKTCKNPQCSKQFMVKPYNPKIFCSTSCAAKLNNKGRKQSPATKAKISLWQKNHPELLRQIHPHKQKLPIICQNPKCHKILYVLPYYSKIRKYCSNKCAMQVIGHQTTSPKASKGKPGIRPDISPEICFYSTWEANIARIFNYQGVEWQYAPKIFDLGKHTYRPDFYLSKENKYIEVKNFMNAYSFNRDQLFRKKYPSFKLEIIDKTKYIQLESQYKKLINNWE